MCRSYAEAANTCLIHFGHENVAAPDTGNPDCFYRSKEDLFWICEPDGEGDPGVLCPTNEAIPMCQMTAQRAAEIIQREARPDAEDTISPEFETALGLTFASLGIERPRQLHKTGHEQVVATVEAMEPIPAGANPFHYDQWPMGTDLSRGWIVMHNGPDRKEEPQALEWIYLVNTRSGQRIRINLEHQ